MSPNTNKNRVPDVTIPMCMFSNENEQLAKEGSPHFQCPSPEISKVSPGPNKSPQCRSLESELLRRRSSKTKPKSRFGQPSMLIDSQTLENLTPLLSRDSSEVDQQQASISSRTASCKEGEMGKENEGPTEKEIYQRISAQLSARNTRRLTVKYAIQLVIFLLILGCLVSSLSVWRFRSKGFLGLEFWKWFVLLMVIFCGMLVTHWVVHLMVFLIEWKFLLKKNVVYFTYGLKNDVEVVIWLGLVIATWTLLFKSHVEASPRIEKILDYLNWTLVSLLIGSFMWLTKTALIKLLASWFHLNGFFDRIQVAIFHHYILQVLSGRPVVELAGGQASFHERTNNQEEKKAITFEKIHSMKQEKVPYWTMKLLVDVVLNSGVSTMSGKFAEDVVEGGVELDDDEITIEEEAITTAYRIFDNMVRRKDDKSHIDRDDLHRFMIREEVDHVYPLFVVNDEDQITFKAFSEWVVKVYKDRQALKHALNDNKTAIRQLDKLLTALLILFIILLWTLLTEILTMKVLILVSTTLASLAFFSKNTLKTLFESMVFVFLMHPFDVGDRCVVDGTVMLVEEMNLLTTVFLKTGNNEKVYYPNAILGTKPIGNYYRSPNQGDTLEFSIDYTTRLLKIGELKDRIKQYLEQNSTLWHPDHSVVVEEIENVNKIKMALYVNHTMNFQDMKEKNRRRSELVLEMKTIFDELGIRYNLLPQEILLRKVTING